MIYYIDLDWCPDCRDRMTSIKIELTESELEIVKKIALQLNENSTSDCMPRMIIWSKDNLRDIVFE